MAADYTIAGLDIGTSKICCVMAKPCDQGLEIIGVGQSPLPLVRHGQLPSIEGAATAIRSAVDQARRMAGTDVHGVVVGFADRSVRSKNVTGMIALNRSEVGDQEIRRVLGAAYASVMSQESEFLHLIPREYQVDTLDGVTDPRGMVCSRLEVRAHLVTAGSVSVRNTLKSCQRAGLSVDGLVLQALAAADAVLTADEKELGVALLDIGAGSTDLAVFKHGVLWYTAVLPGAGGQITADIARQLRILPTEAEQLKVRYGSCSVQHGEAPQVRDKVISRAELSALITARIEALVSEVATHTRRSRHGGRLIAGLVITGGTALLPDLDIFVEQMTTVPVRIGLPTGYQGLVDQVNHPACAVAVGLLRQRDSLLVSPFQHEPAPPSPKIGFLNRALNWFRKPA